ncbi:MAG: hypothetical protein ACR2I8_04850, partial [Steroidobacteraceae bacterium]
MHSLRWKLSAAAWWLLTGAVVAAGLLLRFRIHLFPGHDLNFAALPVLALALVAGPVAGSIAAIATAAIAFSLGSLSPLLGLLLLAAPILGWSPLRRLHPAYACLVLPLAASLLSALTYGGGHERMHLLTVDLLQASISVVLAYGIALGFGARVPQGNGGWAGRPLTHRLFVTLATVATLLTVGLGLLSVTNLQQRQVQYALANLQLLSLEIAESSQVLLSAHGRSLSA